MRKKDVFGKKVNTSKPLYYLIFVFAITITGFILINLLLNLRLSELKASENELHTAINQELLLEQDSTYKKLEEIIPYLPVGYNELEIYNELNLVNNLSEMQNLDQYSLSIKNNASNPFDMSLSNDLRYVEISITMTIDDYNKIFDYIHNLASLDRIYYIDNMSASVIADKSAIVTLNIYTFYLT